MTNDPGPPGLRHEGIQRVTSAAMAGSLQWRRPEARDFRHRGISAQQVSLDVCARKLDDGLRLHLVRVRSEGEQLQVPPLQHDKLLPVEAQQAAADTAYACGNSRKGLLSRRLLPASAQPSPIETTAKQIAAGPQTRGACSAGSAAAQLVPSTGALCVLTCGARPDVRYMGALAVMVGSARLGRALGPRRTHGRPGKVSPPVRALHALPLPVPRA